MEKEILEKNVYYYKNVIPNPKQFVELIESTENEDWGTSITKWEEWTACSGEMYLYGAEKTVNPSDKERTEEGNKIGYIYNTVMNAFFAVCKDYAEAHDDYDSPINFPLFDIKKYSPGTFMGAHYDQQEGDTRLKYSLVFYLNDDYEGGEISFTIESPNAPIFHSKPEQDYSIAKEGNRITFAIKPEAGSVIIFPSSPPYHHTAHLVKNGFKYMVPLHWYKTMEPVNNNGM